MADLDHPEESPPINDLDLLNKNTIYAMNRRKAESYNFKVFDPVADLKEVNYVYNALICAKSGAGKSVFMRDVLHQTKDMYVEAYVFCTTAHLQPDLYDFIPKENRIMTFDEKRLQEIYDAQTNLIIKLRAQKVDEKKFPRLLIIFDDLISDPAVRRSKLLLKLYISGRHSFITTFFLTQTLVGITPNMRKNVRLAVGYYLENEDDRKSFANSYLSTENNRLGVMVFDSITKITYQAVVILNYEVRKQNPENYIRTYIANLKTRKFKIGGKKVGEALSYHSLFFGEIKSARNAIKSDNIFG